MRLLTDDGLRDLDRRNETVLAEGRGRVGKISVGSRAVERIDVGRESEAVEIKSQQVFRDAAQPPLLWETKPHPRKRNHLE